MQHLIPCIISFEKGGFFLGRGTMEGVILAHEVLHSINSNHSLNFVKQLDIMKPYDRVVGNFFFKFFPKWVFQRIGANGLRHVFRVFGFQY